ncbi:MAG: DUF262 domain-containing protein [bacterium]
MKEKYTRFKDIPQFISNGRYSINVPINALRQTLDSYIKEYGLELNPDFQRGHVWTEEQQIAFVEYVLSGGRSGREIYLNHTRWSTGEDGWFVLVDGLQRITALLRFLNDEIKAFGSYYSEYTDFLRHHVDLIFSINELGTKKEVLEWYIQMNRGGTVHSDEEIQKVRRMIEGISEKEKVDSEV